MFSLAFALSVCASLNVAAMSEMQPAQHTSNHIQHFSDLSTYTLAVDVSLIISLIAYFVLALLYLTEDKHLTFSYLFARYTPPRSCLHLKYYINNISPPLI
jgi:heme/copper-type cytochrome/quinol oxidase subunit 2